MSKSWMISVGCLLAVVAPAHAHIKLTKPASWIEEGPLGDPQKSGPCGPGAGETMTPTGEVTTFKAGEEITVEWTETIPHPGHFRIAVAANRADLKDPELPLVSPATSCDYDESMKPTAAGNVLADAVDFRSTEGFSEQTGKTFSAKVKLPSEPCEKCTLQVIQWMESHPPPCIYYHCADIKIVAADSAAGGGGAGGSAAGSVAVGGTGGAAAGSAANGGTTAASAAAGVTASTAAGAGAAGTTASSAAAAGKPAAATGGTTGTATTPTSVAGSASPAAPVPAPAPAADSGGCAVAAAGASNSAALWLTVSALGLLLGRRRKS